MNKLRILLLLLWGIFTFWGCQKWGEPEYKKEDWVPPPGTQPSQFWTIDSKFVLGKHENNTPPDSLVPKSYGERLRYIRAVVVSSDEGGNYYKSMVIQDATGGVELELDRSALFNTYPVGQKIVLVCNGLVIGDYGSLPQIGWIYNKTQVGRINSLYFDQYIIRDGMPSLKNVPKPLTNNEIEFSSNIDINKLVRLENVTFEKDAVGKQFSFDKFTTNWKISVPLANGSTRSVTVRTSNYAKFRNIIIEEREYNLTGILTVFGSGNSRELQLMIRTKKDIEFSSPPEPSEFLTFDFTKNPLENEWKTQSLLDNTTWTYRPTSQSMLHLGNGNGNISDDWFISPVINYPDMAKGFLIFEHQLSVPNAQYDAYQIYYTTSTATTFNINDWKPLGTLNSFPNEFGWSNSFPLSIINANNFRIAFRYNSPNINIETYNWSIRKMEIRN